MQPCRPWKTRCRLAVAAVGARNWHQRDDAFDEQSEEYYKLGLKYSADTDSIHPAVIGKQLGDFLYNNELDREQTTVISGWLRHWSLYPALLAWLSPWTDL